MVVLLYSDKTKNVNLLISVHAQADAHHSKWLSLGFTLHLMFRQSKATDPTATVKHKRMIMGITTLLLLFFCFSIQKFTKILFFHFVFFIYSGDQSTSHIDTLISFHDFSMRAAWAGHWLLGQLKQLWGENHGRKQFSKLWREGSMYLYVMWIHPMIFTHSWWFWWQVDMACIRFHFQLDWFSGSQDHSVEIWNWIAHQKTVIEPFCLLILN